MQSSKNFQDIFSCIITVVEYKTAFNFVDLFPRMERDDK